MCIRDRNQAAAVTGIGQINRSHLIAGLTRDADRPLVILCQDDMAARRLQEELKGFLTFVKETLGEQVKEVKLSENLGSHPVCMVPEGGMSFEMEKYMKRVNPEFAFPVGRILELNPEHEAVKAMEAAMVGDTQKAKDYAALLHGQALLMADLPLEDPAEFGRLVCKLMK